MVGPRGEAPRAVALRRPRGVGGGRQPARSAQGGWSQSAEWLHRGLSDVVI